MDMINITIREARVEIVDFSNPCRRSELVMMDSARGRGSLRRRDRFRRARGSAYCRSAPFAIAIPDNLRPIRDSNPSRRVSRYRAQRSATRIANDLRKPAEMFHAKIECVNMSAIAFFVDIPTIHRQPWETRSCNSVLWIAEKRLSAMLSRKRWRTRIGGTMQEAALRQESDEKKGEPNDCRLTPPRQGLS